MKVMKLLELNEIEDKLVGSIGDGGLSVEEAKRLTIGVELVSQQISELSLSSRCFLITESVWRDIDHENLFLLNNFLRTRAGSKSKHFISR